MTEELVAIAYEFSPLKANLIRTRLEADGIECFLAGETLTSVVGSFSHAAASWEHPEGNIAIQVRASDVDEAVAILQALEARREDESDEDDGDEDREEVKDSRLSHLFFRLFIIAWLSYVAFAATGAVVGGFWGTFDKQAGILAGIVTFILLSALAFKKSFKSER